MTMKQNCAMATGTKKIRNAGMAGKKHLTWVTALILSHFGTSYLL